jgi:1-acyl-sn-glycerol-3-phosphate acyltransferase
MSKDVLPYYKVPPYFVIHCLWQLNQRWFKPQFHGLDHLDIQQPALYIGNHTIYGLDCPALLSGLYQHKKIWLRGLADHVHFYVPFWGRQLKRFGAFDGNRKAVIQLMQAGEHILIYPGGSREVLKNKDEAYQLIWKERLGFADLAIQYGYDIIPFAAYGGEETLDIIYDADAFNQSWLGKFAQKTGFSDKFLRSGEFFPPIARGYRNILFFPKQTALHFQFMPRIETAHYQRNATENNKWALRQKVEEAIEQGLSQLKPTHNIEQK